MSARRLPKPSGLSLPAWRRRWRLQSRIGVAVAGLMLALALALAAVLLGMAEQRFVRLATANLTGLADQLARELSSGMDRLGLEVQTLAARDSFRRRGTPPAEMRAALEGFQKLHPEFAYLGVLDADTGVVLAASGGLLEGTSLRGRTVYDRGRERLFLGDVHKAVRLAELLPRPPDGDVLRFLDVAVPVEDGDGRAFRVLATHVAWGWTRQIRDGVIGPVTRARGVEAMLVDTEDRVVLASSPAVPVGTELGALVRSAAAQPVRQRWLDGHDALTVTQPVAPLGRFAGFGWKVVVRQPHADIVAPLAGLRRALLASALALGLGAALFAWWVTSRIVRPVRLLAEDARRDAPAGGTEAAADPPAGELDEVSAMRGALSRLSDRARDRARAADVSERQFAALVRTLPHPVWIADRDGAMRFVNRDALDDGAQGRMPGLGGLLRLTLPQDRAAIEDAWRQARAEGKGFDVRVRLAMPPPTSAPRWTDCEANPIVQDEGAGQEAAWIGTLVDVHDEVLASQRSAHALDLEREARAQAERLVRARDEFIANISHELRSPLSPMLGWAEILTRQSQDPTVRKAAAVIQRNAQLQAGLINDLIDMSAALAGKLTVSLQPVDLAQLAREATASAVQAGEKKAVAVAMAGAPDATTMVMADPRRLAQVLSNLLDNAIKFTDERGRVDVRVASEGGAGVVTVTDTGCGMSEAFLPFVFDRLRQEDASRTRRVGGLGLGLAIVKALVELQGGRVSAGSPGPGQGATFSVALKLAQPAAAAPEGAAGDPDAAPTALQGRRILVVDDETDPRESTCAALSMMGATVRPAASAAEALECLAGEPFDAIVSDIAMPRMDGLALIRAVRALPDDRARAIPAVALTAFAMDEDRAAGLAAGFQGYVNKPVSLRQLSAVMVEVLGAQAAS